MYANESYNYYCFNLTRSCGVISKEIVASNSELDVGIFGGRRRGRITLSSCSRISQPRCIRNARAVIDDNKHGFKTHNIHIYGVFHLLHLTTGQR